MKFTESFLPRVENDIRNGEQLYKTFGTTSRKNIVMWLDLLGFQKQLAEDREIALKRISVFHEISLTSMTPNFHIAQLNDATVMSLDLEPNISDKLNDFLLRCDALFEMSTYADRRVGGFGSRGVISTGLRQSLRGNFGGIALDGNLTVDKIVFSSPIPIMMNMAFAEAYLLESSGELLKEPSLYIDESLYGYPGLQISPTWGDYGVLEFRGIKYLTVRRDQE